MDFGPWWVGQNDLNAGLCALSQAFAGEATILILYQTAPPRSLLYKFDKSGVKRRSGFWASVLWGEMQELLMNRCVGRRKSSSGAVRAYVTWRAQTLTVHCSAVSRKFSRCTFIHAATCAVPGQEHEPVWWYSAVASEIYDRFDRWRKLLGSLFLRKIGCFAAKTFLSALMLRKKEQF